MSLDGVILLRNFGNSHLFYERRDAPTNSSSFSVRMASTSISKTFPQLARSFATASTGGRHKVVVIGGGECLRI